MYRRHTGASASSCGHGFADLDLGLDVGDEQPRTLHGDQFAMANHTPNVDRDRLFGVGECFFDRFALAEAAGQGWDNDCVTSLVRIGIEDNRVSYLHRKSSSSSTVKPI
jgi:hypothetical protein